jgi:hypothetical protein
MLASSLEALKGIGVRLAIDDFGSAYSSLGYLRRYEFDIIKIDKSFADGLGTGPQGSVLAAGIVKLGQSLGLHTCAEGDRIGRATRRAECTWLRTGPRVLLRQADGDASSVYRCGQRASGETLETDQYQETAGGALPEPRNCDSPPLESNSCLAPRVSVGRGS